jgi:hypothetical protein
MTKIVHTFLLMLIVSVYALGQYSGSGPISLGTPSGATSVQWYKDGSVISGATNSTYVASTPGIYYASYTDGGTTCNSDQTIQFVLVANGTTVTLNGTTNNGSGTDYQWLNQTGPIQGATTSNYTTSTGGIYTLTYTSTGCTVSSQPYYVFILPLDSDNDGIADVDDLDDDNDGILDSSENLCSIQNISKTGVTVSSTLTWTASLSLLVDGSGVSGHALPNAALIANETILQFDLPNAVNLSLIELTPYVSSLPIVLGSVVNIQGWNGTTWQTIKAYQTVTTPTTGIADPSLLSYKFDLPNNSSSYTKYRIQGVSGSMQGNWASEVYFTGPCSSSQNDLDGDGLVNSLDLDSDGDGCPDGIEGGAAFTTTNLVTSAMAGGNSGGGFTGTSTNSVIKNLGNTVGNTTTTMGVPTIAGTGQTVGTSQNGATFDANCVICNAGTTPPIITPTSVTNTCPAMTFSLAALANTGVKPAGTTLIWSTHKVPTSAEDTLTNLTSVSSSGLYYALYFDKTNNCYSPADSVSATIINCSDTDGDGKLNTADLDDDNDGILDTAENCTLPNFNGNVSSNYALFTGAFNPMKSGSVSILAQTVWGTYVASGSYLSVGSCSAPSPDWGGGNITFSSPLTNAVIRVEAMEFGTEYLDVEILAPYTGTPSLAFTSFENNAYVIQLSPTKWRINSGVNCTSGQCYSGGNIQITGAFYSKLQISGGSQTNDSWCRNVRVILTDAVVQGACNTDIDGDGISNEFDLDSDGDGCPDAIEGGSTFTTSNLVNSAMAGGNSGTSYNGTSTTPVIQNLGNTVGATGIPTVATTGQNIGYSQNGGANACIDSDNDSIANVDDLDDDNDGIRDTDENCNLVNPSNITNTNGVLNNIATINGSTPSATKNGTTVVGAVGVSGTSNILSSNTLILGNHLAQSPDWGTADMLFQSPITNVAFGIDGMEFGSEYVSIEILQPYTGTPQIQFFTPKLGGTITQTSPTSWRITSGQNCGNSATCPSGGIVQITGAFYNKIRFGGGSVSGWPSTNITWNKNVTVSLQDAVVQGTCNEDIDGDGIPNELDLDSDGDGCTDAIEGGAALTTSNLANSALNGGNSGAGYTGPSSIPVTQNLGNTVGSTGIPTIANTGQSLGTSQNATILDPACCTAGSTAPIITATSVNNTCPDTTFSLAALTNTGTQPSGTTLIWSTHKVPTSAADTLTNLATVSTAGKYYAMYYGKIANCYSPADSVTATITTCVPICLAGTSAPNIKETLGTNSCPATTLNLGVFTHLDTTPSGATLVWSLHKVPSSVADTLSNLTVGTAGKYYAMYHDKVNNCFSPADSITFTLIDCTQIIVSNVCPATTVNLTSAFSISGTLPANSIITWHTALPVSDANRITTVTSVLAGSYYAAIKDTVNNCYSPGSQTVTVVINNCGTVLSCDAGLLAPMLIKN